MRRGRAKWAGRCEACGAWNSLVEEVPRAAPPKSLGAERRPAAAARLDFVAPARRQRRAAAPPDRHRRARPGVRRRPRAGLGDPGRRRSRHRQVDAAAAGRRRARRARRRAPPTSPARRRSTRSGCAPSGSASPTRRCGSPRRAACATSSPRSTRRAAPDLVVIDSIQTMYLDTLDSAPGTVSQVRGAAQELIGLAKRRGIVVVLVGHVTKEGADRRPARARAHGRHRALFRGRARPPVPHPARGQEPLRRDRRDRRVRDERPRPRRGAEPVGAVPRRPRRRRRRAGRGRVATAGAAVFAGIEGTRPVLVEVQALVAPSPLGTPRRAVVGWDATRLAMIMAVLDARCGLSVGANDIYLNVAGGLRIVEPAADLAVAAALVSALTEIAGAGRHRRVRRDRPLGPGAAGRPCRCAAQGGGQARLCRGLGAGAAVRPRRASASDGLETVPIGHLSELVARLSPSPRAGGICHGTRRKEFRLPARPGSW